MEDRKDGRPTSDDAMFWCILWAMMMAAAMTWF